MNAHHFVHRFPLFLELDLADKLDQPLPPVSMGSLDPAADWQSTEERGGEGKGGGGRESVRREKVKERGMDR